jgi:hypothetical protein
LGSRDREGCRRLSSAGEVWEVEFAGHRRGGGQADDARQPRRGSSHGPSANVPSNGCLIPRPVKDCHSVLTLSSISVPSPLLVFSQATARRNASRAISLLAQRRSDRDEVERFLADRDAQQHSAGD